MTTNPLATSLLAQLATHRSILAACETSRDSAQRTLTLETHAHQTYAQASAVIAHCDASIAMLQKNIAHLTDSLTSMGIDTDGL